MSKLLVLASVLDFGIAAILQATHAHADFPFLFTGLALFATAHLVD